MFSKCLCIHFVVDLKFTYPGNETTADRDALRIRHDFAVIGSQVCSQLAMQLSHSLVYVTSVSIPVKRGEIRSMQLHTEKERAIGWRRNEDLKTVVSGLPRVSLAVSEAALISSPKTRSLPLIQSQPQGMEKLELLGNRILHKSPQGLRKGRFIVNCSF